MSSPRVGDTPKNDIKLLSWFGGNVNKSKNVCHVRQSVSFTTRGVTQSRLVLEERLVRESKAATVKQTIPMGLNKRFSRLKLNHGPVCSVLRLRPLTVCVCLCAAVETALFPVPLLICWCSGPDARRWFNCRVMLHKM